AVRVSADMFIGEAGTQLERDVLPFVQLVDHLVDVWDVNVSGISEWGEDATPSRFYPQGRLLPWQAAVKSVSKKPVLGVGRWTNPDAMVDAGPAGMECAMILGKRGMRRVHLVEAQDDMGGIMRWIPQLPGLGEWARLVNYRKIQIDKLRNVEFIPDTKLDAQGVKEYGAEIVVVATGAYWATDGLNGATHDTIPGADASLPHILTPEQLMVEGKQAPGERGGIG